MFRRFNPCNSNIEFFHLLAAIPFCWCKIYFKTKLLGHKLDEMKSTGISSSLHEDDRRLLEGQGTVGLLKSSDLSITQIVMKWTITATSIFQTAFKKCYSVALGE